MSNWKWQKCDNNVIALVVISCAIFVLTVACLMLLVSCGDFYGLLTIATKKSHASLDPLRSELFAHIAQVRRGLLVASLANLICGFAIIWLPAPKRAKMVIVGFVIFNFYVCCFFQ